MVEGAKAVVATTRSPQAMIFPNDVIVTAMAQPLATVFRQSLLQRPEFLLVI
jgi:hypothetical protein